MDTLKVYIRLIHKKETHQILCYCIVNALENVKIPYLTHTKPTNGFVSQKLTILISQIEI